MTAQTSETRALLVPLPPQPNKALVSVATVFRYIRLVLFLGGSFIAIPVLIALKVSPFLAVIPIVLLLVDLFIQWFRGFYANKLLTNFQAELRNAIKTGKVPPTIRFAVVDPLSGKVLQTLTSQEVNDYLGGSGPDTSSLSGDTGIEADPNDWKNAASL